MSELKQVIVIRRDLWMRPGKAIAQGAHASLGAVLDKASAEDINDWIESGNKKVVCKVGSEVELLELQRHAEAAKLPTYLVRDAGYTEVMPNTPTALAIGPYESNAIDRITSHLELY